MAKNETQKDGLFRLHIANEDAMRFEFILRENQINFQPYEYADQNLVRDFVFKKSDMAAVDDLIIKNSITSGDVYYPMTTSNVVKSYLLYIKVAAIVAVISLLIVLMTRLL